MKADEDREFLFQNTNTFILFLLCENQCAVINFLNRLHLTHVFCRHPGNSVLLFLFLYVWIYLSRRRCRGCVTLVVTNAGELVYSSSHSALSVLLAACSSVLEPRRCLVQSSTFLFGRKRTRTVWCGARSQKAELEKKSSEFKTLWKCPSIEKLMIKTQQRPLLLICSSARARFSSYEIDFWKNNFLRTHGSVTEHHTCLVATYDTQHTSHTYTLHQDFTLNIEFWCSTS